MKIISLINSKGGVGKTTLCVNLARYVQMYHCNKLQDYDCKNVLLIDADTQGSLRDWHDAGGSIYLDLLVSDKKSSIVELPKVLKDTRYEYIFIDTPGTLNDVIGAAISISDLVLIPMEPSPFDVWASQDVTELIKTRRAVLSTDLPKAFYVLNACIKGTKAEKDVMEYLKSGTIVPLYQCIYRRVDYAVTVSNGLTIFETNNKQAIDETKTLGSLLMSNL